MASNSRKKRIPKLNYTELRGIGWHVSFRDPQTGNPRKHRFQADTQAEAERAYHEWVASYLHGILPEQQPRRKATEETPHSESNPKTIEAEYAPGSLLDVTSGLLEYEESRVRPPGEARRSGTITRDLFNDRQAYTREFLGFINTRHGKGAVKSLTITDLTLHDVEAYNRMLVSSGYSASQVTKRLRFVKNIVSRAGRPEYGSQALTWNWSALDILHGKAPVSRKLPTLNQIKLVLSACNERQTAIVWLAIGCGFGQRDIAAIKVNHFDSESYDLRRGKTGIDRYGQTPKLVWDSMQAYLKTTKRQSEDLLFVTRKGLPVVHNKADSIVQWWTKLRQRLGDQCKDLDGFYILRHLGATEFGSRPGCSISSMKRWLGHSASSQIADVYMKPVSPENRNTIKWVRECLSTGKVDLKIQNESRL